MRLAAIAALLALVSAGHASAFTLLPGGSTEVGFIDEGYGSGIIFESSGFRFATSMAYTDGASVMNLHDDSGLRKSFITRTDGRRFGVKSAVQSMNWRLYRTADSAPPVMDPDDPYSEEYFRAYRRWSMDSRPSLLNYGWYGWRNGVLVATLEGMTGPENIRFGSDFRLLDRLEIRLITPAGASKSWDHGMDLIQPGKLWCDEYCGELFVKSVSFAPAAVTLPAGFPLLAIGLGILTLFTRRKAERIRVS